MIEINLAHPKLPPPCPFRTGDIVAHRLTGRRGLVVDRLVERVADLRETYRINGRDAEIHRVIRQYFGSFNTGLMVIKTGRTEEVETVPWLEWFLLARPSATDYRPRKSKKRLRGKPEEGVEADREREEEGAP